jgi:hypothetical protein
MMKRLVPILIMLLLMLATVVRFVEDSQPSSTAIAAWVDRLAPKPADKPYLSMHYRLRTLFFSLEPEMSNPVFFVGDSLMYGGEWENMFPKSQLKTEASAAIRWPDCWPAWIRLPTITHLKYS